jgi:hypothetical protein
MKKRGLFLTGLLLILISSSFQLITAQGASKDEKQTEEEILRAIDEQKKAMAMQRNAHEDALIIMKQKQIEAVDKFKDIQMEIETDGIEGNRFRFFDKRSGRAYSYEEPFNFTAPDIQAFYGHSYDDEERTTWDFSKSVKENTFSRDYTFFVEKNAKTVVMSVMGDCKAGDIRIKIIMPGGKNYSDIVIDEFGNLNWRKSFTITESENQDKTGEWKFQINSSKATGFFKISLKTY